MNPNRFRCPEMTPTQTLPYYEEKHPQQLPASFASNLIPPQTNCGWHWMTPIKIERWPMTPWFLPNPSHWWWWPWLVLRPWRYDLQAKLGCLLWIGFHLSGQKNPSFTERRTPRQVGSWHGETRTTSGGYPGCRSLVENKIVRGKRKYNRVNRDWGRSLDQKTYVLDFKLLRLFNYSFTTIFSEWLGFIACLSSSQLTSRYIIISPSSGEQTRGRRLLIKSCVDLVDTPTLTVTGKREKTYSIYCNYEVWNDQFRI